MHPTTSLIAATGVLLVPLLVGCGSSGDSTPPPAASTPRSSSPATESSPTEPATSPSAGTGDCPVIASSDLDAIVGTHLTDHYKSTQQPAAGTPLAGTVLCDFANSDAGRTAKVASGAVAKVGTVDELLARLGTDCPAVSGVGDKAFGCVQGDGAIVVAQSGDRVVMAYRGGNPGGTALLNQATEIARTLLENG